MDSAVVGLSTVQGVAHVTRWVAQRT
jgi:hypothetical protein